MAALQDAGPAAPGRFRWRVWRAWRGNLIALIVGVVAVVGTLSGSWFFMTADAFGAASVVHWQKGHSIVVWLSPDATYGQVNTLKAELSRATAIDGCVYRSQLADYKEARKLLPASESAELNAPTTPASIRCSFRQSSPRRNLVKEFSGQPGVRSVVVPYEEILS